MGRVLVRGRAAVCGGNAPCVQGGMPEPEPTTMLSHWMWQTTRKFGLCAGVMVFCRVLVTLNGNPRLVRLVSEGGCREEGQGGRGGVRSPESMHSG